ncbi:tetratricopeptide repeat protein [Vulgatibacter incomptus]|uniref:Uncharacterized protein n=1 Tax=Vulgatibacter incomptus TaxID=1391653 RepID=A0A0K1PBU7_9BACT|nr:tetratricopeptide repeat protein [Vulgatibacter incomptus]AKU90594.1 hypothetical protein AKJ08_0981 [Vulgatibacter incomptus]
MRSVRLRPIRLVAALAALLSTVLPVAAGAARPLAGSHGVATPSEESWGDEGFEAEARRLGEAEERRLVEEAAHRAGLTAARRGQAAPAPEAADPDKARRLEADDELARLVVLPEETLEDLEHAWRDRREAVARGDLLAAATAESRVLDLRHRLDVAELDTFAAAAVRESQALTWSDPAAALARAQLAVALSPSLPAAHLSRLAARFAADPWDVADWGHSGLEALRAGLGHERHLRPFLADLGVAAGLALALTGAFTLLLLALRHGRHVLHDFHHLFPRQVARLQSGAVALVLLALPVAFGLGPLVFASGVVAAIWLYLSRTEKTVLGVWLVVLGLLPAGAGWLADRTAWSGTLAEVVDRVDRGADLRLAEALAPRSEAKDPRPEELFALARVEKRQGKLDAAESLFARALVLRPGWAHASVGLGNVRFLRGDWTGAARLYDEALEADPGLAETWFNLSRVYYRQVDFPRGQQARDRAVELDPTLVARYGKGGGEPDAAGGHRFLADPSLREADLVALATRPGESARVTAQIAGWLAPRVPAPLVTWLGLVIVAGLAALASFRGRVRPSRGCARCGRSVCERCDPETSRGPDCGQCVHVFGRRGRVDPAARVRKELAVASYRARRGVVLRCSAILLAAPALKGRAARGALVIGIFAFFGILLAISDGVIRPAFVFDAAWKAALLTTATAATYLLGIREGWKEPG